MIILRNLSVGYRNNILIDQSNSIFQDGRVTSLVGCNGSGKSTLLRTIAGLLPPKNGFVEVQGYNASKSDSLTRARLISLVTTTRIHSADMTCEYVVAAGRAPYTNWIGSITNSDSLIIDNALEAVGMKKFAKKSILKLSDGEYQRIMIARAIAQNTPNILLDEPTSFLDYPSRLQILDLLKDIARKQEKCIVLSTHELDLALRKTDNLAIINEKRLSLFATSDPSIPEKLGKAFPNLPPMIL